MSRPTTADHDAGEPVLWSGGAHAAPWFPVTIGAVTGDDAATTARVINRLL